MGEKGAETTPWYTWQILIDGKHLLTHKRKKKHRILFQIGDKADTVILHIIIVRYICVKYRKRFEPAQVFFSALGMTPPSLTKSEGTFWQGYSQARLTASPTLETTGIYKILLSQSLKQCDFLIYIFKNMEIYSIENCLKNMSTNL